MSDSLRLSVLAVVAIDKTEMTRVANAEAPSGKVRAGLARVVEGLANLNRRSHKRQWG